MVQAKMFERNFTRALAAILLFTLVKAAMANESDQIVAKQIIENWARTFTEHKSIIGDEEYTMLKQREYGKKIYAQLKQFDWKNFNDPLLKRQFEVLLRGDGYPDGSYELTNAIKILQNMAHEHTVCQRNQPDKCNMAFVPQIKAIFTNSQDPNELMYYWREWREKIPSNVKSALSTYIDYYRNTVRGSNTNTSGLWYSDYDDANTFDMLEQVWENILPLYKELHAHLRQLLKRHYGENIVLANGLIPHHLLQKAVYQAWKKYSILNNPYESKRLPNLQAEIEHNFAGPRKFITTCLDFFESLGFEPYGPEFINKHFQQRENGLHDCKAIVDEYYNQVHYCSQMNYKKLMQMHGYVARLEYNIARSNLSFGLNRESAPGFGDAIGEAVILSVSNPKHLQTKLNLLKDYNYDEQRNLNRMYRMAVHTLLTLPAYLVNERLWIDIINGKVTSDQYSCHYWDLMQKYMGVDTSVETLPGTYDMPDKFYEGIHYETSSTRKLFGEFMGYRLYRDVCQHIGEFQPGNSAKPLNQCDWSNNKEAGNILRQVMSFGSKKPWKEVLNSLLFASKDENDGSAFLQYYEPVWNWLKTDNADNNITIGWQNVKHC